MQIISRNGSILSANQQLNNSQRDSSMPDEAIDLEYLADNLWFVGSPETADCSC